MRRVVVVGGYGHLGARCVRELIETTRAQIVVAGRSAQRAERAALAHGERARGAYANAADPRTLATVAPGASCLLVCAGADCGGAIEAALSARVPLVVAAPLALDAGARAELGERAWKAQVPLVLGAGAVPGLPGVAAERLVRELAEIEHLRIASTGAWEGTPTAAATLSAFRAASGGAREYREGAWQRAQPRGVHLAVAGPLGGRTLRPAASPDLVGFPEAHCVRSLVYLEPSTGLLERTLQRALRRTPPPGFALRAEARTPDGASASLEIEASDAPAAAAPALAVLVRALLAGRVPAGLALPREALGPAVWLDALEKRGVRVRLERAHAIA